MTKDQPHYELFANEEAAVSSQSFRMTCDPGRAHTRRSIAPDLILRDVAEIRARVAGALDTRTGDVVVNRYARSRSGLMMRCTGRAGETRFFAKIFLANPYPIPDRFRAPWEERGDLSGGVRTLDDQIAIEWEMTARMRALPGGECIPAPLGRSPKLRTIVWKEARGTVLQRAVKRSGWSPSFERAGKTALLRAGQWLRNIHEASAQKTESIEAWRVVRLLENEVRGESRGHRKYREMAIEVLKRAIQTAGTSAFIVPVALTHGDFCLSNLIWEPGGCQLNVVDFESSGYRPTWHDLFTLVASLRAQLLNPAIPKRVILEWEDSFWEGYGPVLPLIPVFVKAFALSYLLQHDLSRLLTRRERLGWLAGVNASLYRLFFERYVITKRLDLTPQ